MSQVAIENPVINSPFDEPTRHFRFSDDGISDEQVEGRGTSSYFVPSRGPRRRASSFNLPRSGNGRGPPRGVDRQRSDGANGLKHAAAVSSMCAQRAR
jgi:hypothetical protein